MYGSRLDSHPLLIPRSIPLQLPPCCGVTPPCHRATHTPINLGRRKREGQRIVPLARGGIRQRRRQYILMRQWVAAGGSGAAAAVSATKPGASGIRGSIWSTVSRGREGGRGAYCWAPFPAGAMSASILWLGASSMPYRVRYEDKTGDNAKTEGVCAVEGGTMRWEVMQRQRA